MRKIENIIWIVMALVIGVLIGICFGLGFGEMQIEKICGIVFTVPFDLMELIVTVRMSCAVAGAALGALMAILLILCCNWIEKIKQK